MRLLVDDLVLDCCMAKHVHLHRILLLPWPMYVLSRGRKSLGFMSYSTVYCNSLLATLNARKGIRGGESRSDEMSLSLQGVQQKTNGSMIGVSSRVSFSRGSIDHGLIVSSARAKQYFHQDRHHPRMRSG